MKKNIPLLFPLKIQQVIDGLKKTRTKQECLHKAYRLLTAKYHGNRLKTVTRFLELCPRSVDAVWARSGFLHCTNLNWLLRVLLVKSGHFTEEDIETCWTLLWYVSPHQYLRVKLDDGQQAKVDVWANVYGIGFGDYAHGFHNPLS